MSAHSTTELVRLTWLNAWGRVRSESRPVSVAALACGSLSLAIVILGPLVLLASEGVLEPESIVRALRSTTMWVFIVLGLGGGATSVVLAVSRFRRLDTRLARKESIVGGVLGLEATVAGALLGSFIVLGDLTAFTRNFLNFGQVNSWRDAFLSGAATTLGIAFSALAIGLVLGLVVSVFLISPHAVARAPARLYVNVFRGTPFLVQLSVIYFGLAIGLGIRFSPQVALTITVGLEASGYMAEVFRAGIQSVPRGQLDAARGLGLGYLSSLRYVVLPQAGRAVVPPLMNDFITIIKDTSFLIFVGVSVQSRDLFAVARQGYNEFYNSSFFIAAGLGYLAITLPLIWLVNKVERHVRKASVS